MDHSELIAELPIIEKLTPAERIQLARQRRTLQLLKWRDREKTELQMAPLIEQRNRRVVFGLNIALLEATARNDVDEGFTFRNYFFILHNEIENFFSSSFTSKRRRSKFT